MHSDEKRSHVKAWQSSGLTKAAYSRKQGVNSKTFSRWCRQYHSETTDTPGLASVAIQSTETSRNHTAIKLQLRSGSVLELPRSSFPALVGRAIAMSGLIDYPDQVWLVIEPMDLRRGIDGLSQWLEQTLEVSPCAGSAYIFRNRTGRRIKVLLWDGTGVWLCSRRLHQGHFVWPKRNERRWVITSREWQWLI